jgi:hypothetical protein
MNKLFINKHIKIKDYTVFVDGNADFSERTEHFATFAKSIYKNYNIKYSKFYKMDLLSKLGFLASELLLNDSIQNFLPEETAVILANSSSSLNTDKKYQDTIAEHPSPSVFVYTLPNIVIGEICIRNTFRGESLFLVQESFDTDFLTTYVANLFAETNTKQCIAGWVEMSLDENHHADLYLVSKNDSGKIFDKQNLDILFKT